MLTVSINIVADFKARTFQFITERGTKILTLNLELKPLLFLYIVSNCYISFSSPLVKILQYLFPLLNKPSDSL